MVADQSKSSFDRHPPTRWMSVAKRSSVEPTVMMVFKAGGWRAAICSPLKPPQEMPIIATWPSHQPCAAIQAIRSQPSICSCTEYSSVMIPSLSPVPRMSTRIEA